MRAVLLSLHILCGSLGLVVGPLAMWARKRPARGGRPWHRDLGRAYQLLVIGLCVSAVELAVINPEVWWLAVIAVATQVSAGVGWVTRPSRRPGLVAVHVGTMCGSYVSFVTAFLVVNLDGLVWWLLPTLIGTPLIARAAAAAVRRYAPPARTPASVTG